MLWREDYGVALEDEVTLGITSSLRAISKERASKGQTGILQLCEWLY